MLIGVDHGNKQIKTVHGESIAEYHRSKMELARAMSRLSEAGKRK